LQRLFRAFGDPELWKAGRGDIIENNKKNIYTNFLASANKQEAKELENIYFQSSLKTLQIN